MENIVEADAANWTRAISQSDIPTIVYFWHEQCPWCLRLTPIFNDVAGEYRGRIRFVKINILENEFNREIANQYGVMSTPTLMFFCSGKPLGQGVGFMPKEELEKAMDDLLRRYRTCMMQSTDLRGYIV